MPSSFLCVAPTQSAPDDCVSKQTKDLNFIEMMRLLVLLVAALVCTNVQAERNADMTQTGPGEVQRIADVETFEERCLVNLASPH